MVELPSSDLQILVTRDFGASSDLPGFLLYAALSHPRRSASDTPAGGILKARSHVVETRSPFLKLSNNVGIDPGFREYWCELPHIAAGNASETRRYGVAALR